MTIVDLLDIDAFAMDLDGVVTQTAAVHAAAWRQLFDELLERRARGGRWEPFDDQDYRSYVDGRPRREGIRSFLASRGIALPDGDLGDGPGVDSIEGLASRKNLVFEAQLARSGVGVYPDAVAFLRRAREQPVSLAVVSASENCIAVLAAAHVRELFDAIVDGRDTIALGLRGKPAPDPFLEAARRLASSPERTAVLEDAVAGVEAGRAGRFRLVIGVDRTGQEEALRAAGATEVVTSLDELDLVHGDEKRVHR